MTAPPMVSRRVVEALLAEELPRSAGRRLMLVHGRYDESAPAEFTAEIHGEPCRVRVTHQPSVLGIVDAWQSHQVAGRAPAEVLVVTTPVDDSQLGWDLRGHAMRGRTRTVDRVDVVAQRFGASEADPRIRRETWLVDALLDAEPTGGWRPAGTLLTLDVAVRALISARLGGPEIADGALDAGALLDWSRTGNGPARFAALPEAERAGLTAWLRETVGPAAPVVMALAATGRAGDSMALGVVGGVLTTGEVPAPMEAALAYGSLLGAAQSRSADVRAFTEAVSGVMERWLIEVDSGDASRTAAQRVLSIIERADQLAASAGLTDALAGSPLLPSSFQQRLRELAALLSTSGRQPGAATVAAAEVALAGVQGHALARLRPDRLGVATAAVRLTRWLAGSAPAVPSVAAGVAGHISEWGWVDRALAVLWAGDQVDEPAVSRAYQAVYRAARDRRDGVDEAFSRVLVPWVARAAQVAPGGTLLIEDVLATVVAPLSERQAPVLLVLPGMSSAIAAAFGEQLDGRAWVEVSPHNGRRAVAVTALPSVPAVNRAALLTGRRAVADRAAEREEFAAFWRRHHRAAALFHQPDVGGAAGHRLAEPVVAALAADGIVAVVLDGIGDALDRSPGSLATDWVLDSVRYLPELLDAARGYGRPVVIVSAHGHVVDHVARDASSTPVAAAPLADAARWHAGTAGPGELELAGPRVAYGEGRVVVPWAEEVHYTSRRAGYCGGASLAELAAPILVVTATADSMPSGWAALSPEVVTPSWWNRQVTVQPAQPVPAATPRKSAGRPARARTDPDEPGLFELPTPQPADVAPTPAGSLGTRLVSGPTYAAQRAYVRKPPQPPVIAAVIDALVAADGTLSLAAVAATAGRAGRNPDFFAATLERLLNVEGYPVVSRVDGGRRIRLDVEMLREQFALGAR